MIEDVLFFEVIIYIWVISNQLRVGLDNTELIVIAAQ